MVTIALNSVKRNVGNIANNLTIAQSAKESNIMANNEQTKSIANVAYGELAKHTANATQIAIDKIIRSIGQKQYGGIQYRHELQTDIELSVQLGKGKNTLLVGYFDPIKNFVVTRYSNGSDIESDDMLIAKYTIFAYKQIAFKAFCFEKNTWENVSQVFYIGIKADESIVILNKRVSADKSDKSLSFAIASDKDSYMDVIQSSVKLFANNWRNNKKAKASRKMWVNAVITHNAKGLIESIKPFNEGSPIELTSYGKYLMATLDWTLESTTKKYADLWHISQYIAKQPKA